MITLLKQAIPFGGGIHLPLHKSMSLSQPLRAASIPDQLILPLRQHIGDPTVPIVQRGEQVLKGQQIAIANGAVSAAIHASTSGTVVDISPQPILSPSGIVADCITIEPDGADQWVERHQPLNTKSMMPYECQQLIYESGIVGMGGAGFPSSVKMIPSLSFNIEILVMNAVECEPYISCDEALLRVRATELITGLQLLADIMQADDVVIAIEEHKEETIALLKNELKDYPDIRLMCVPKRYPAGGEKQLVKSLTNIDIPALGLAVDIGVLCYNVNTVMAMYKALTQSEPCISRVVTVTGEGVATPQNLEVLIGTPVEHLIQQCGGYHENFDYLIVGGPMMGYRLKTDRAPITKTTNCLLVVNRKEHAQAMEMPCIHCDECVPVCPVNIQPQKLLQHSQMLDVAELQSHGLFACIECGCCAYVCPSHIPLVEYYRKAKRMVWEDQEARKHSDSYKLRYDKKQQREKIGDGYQENSGDKKTEIQAAVARVQAKRASNNE